MERIEDLSSLTIRSHDDTYAFALMDMYLFSNMAFEFSDGHLSAIVFE